MAKIRLYLVCNRTGIRKVLFDDNFSEYCNILIKITLHGKIAMSNRQIIVMFFTNELFSVFKR